MLYRKGLAAYLAFVFIVPSICFADATTELVTELHVMESSRTLEFAHDYIIAGRSSFGQPSNIALIDPQTHRETDSIPVAHFVHGLQLVSDCDVMAYGAAGYTVLDFCQDPVGVSSYRFDASFVPFVGSYLENGNDAIFSDATDGMYVYRNGIQVSRLGRHVPGAVTITPFNGELWVPNYSGIEVVNVSTGAVNSLRNGDGISGFKYVASINGSMVATARDDGKVAVINPHDKTIQATLDIAGEPEGVTRLGRCAVIADSSRKTVVFVYIDGNKSSVIDEWDAKAAGDRLKMPSMVAVDPDSLAVYLRSTYPCPSCSVTQSSIFKVTSSDHDAVSVCTD